MQVGFFTMPLHPPGSDITQTLEDDLHQLEVLDSLGYSEAWIGEHFTTVWENIPAPDMFIANALARTSDIKLGTGVTCMPNHNPFMIAHRIAQLDHMAKGRFQWGVGSGGFPGDFEVFGFDPATNDHRLMTRESIETILSIWDDPKPGVYEGDYWKFTIPEPVDEFGLRFHLTPYQKPHPPDRGSGRVAELGYADTGGRARLDSNEHQLGAVSHAQHALGRGGAGRDKVGADAGPQRLAHRPRDIRRRYDRASARGGAWRRAAARLRAVLPASDV